MFSTIIEIPKHFQGAMTSRNYFFIAKSTVVQPPLLARLATVSVLLFSWRGISCPSSYLVYARTVLVVVFGCNSKGRRFPPRRIWQRAVNRQPGFRSGNSKRRSPSRYHFPEILKISKKNLQKMNFFKKFGSYRTLKFQSYFHLSIPIL